MLCLQSFDETPAELYRLESPKVPWGDYGHILVHSMTGCTAQDTASPKLQRTGPFVPPISFPGLGCIVVTTAIRRELEDSGLTGFSFIPAIKSVIVRVDWHEWDLLADEPPFHPEGGEPEDYITEDKHSPELARSMPDLWRLVLAGGASELRTPSTGVAVQVLIRAGSWQGADFFRADTTLYNYVSPRARQWLLDRYPPWVSFLPVQTG
jgi:hypothetical protein